VLFRMGVLKSCILMGFFVAVFGDNWLGVNPHDMKRYGGGKFVCDSTKEFDISLVNDDYCDCLDGTDEPGTSACRNGNFFCINKGYLNKTIPSSRVNDGICDCCDGTDELGNKCENTCREDAKDLILNLMKKIEDHKTSLKLKREIIVQSNSLKTQKELMKQHMDDQIIRKKRKN